MSESNGQSKYFGMYGHYDKRVSLLSRFVRINDFTYRLARTVPVFEVS